MGEQEIAEVVQNIFRDILDNNTLVLSGNTTPNDVEEWDSLTHIGLVSAIEKYYKIRFSLRELDDFKNVGDICKAIKIKTTQ